MSKMEQKQVDAFMSCIIDCLVSEHNYKESVASEMVQQSVINNLLETDPEVVLHYSVQYWANDIKEEFEEYAMV